MKERTSKMSRLYKLITSESYSGKFSEADKLTQDILELEVQEKKAHDNVWKKRGALVKRINNVLREAETEVAAVIEGSDDGEIPPAFRAKSAGGDGGWVENRGGRCMDQTLTLHWQERRLGRTLLRTYRDTVDLYDVFPNEKQPRMGPKEDPELQRQIEANEGIFEPLLLEPHPEDRNKFRIIDGDRRWTNSKILVEVQKKGTVQAPSSRNHRPDPDRRGAATSLDLHPPSETRMGHQRKGDGGLQSRQHGWSRQCRKHPRHHSRELDKLVEIYDLSEKLTNLAEPGASITWAREIKNLNRKILTPTVLDTIIKKSTSRRSRIPRTSESSGRY